MYFNQVVEVSEENLKHELGRCLIVCFSFHEIMPDELVARANYSDQDLVAAFSEGGIKTKAVPLQPVLNPLKQQKPVLNRGQWNVVLGVSAMYTLARPAEQQQQQHTFGFCLVVAYGLFSIL